MLSMVNIGSVVPGEEGFEMSINFLSYFVMEDNVGLHLKKYLNPLHQNWLSGFGKGDF